MESFAIDKSFYDISSSDELRDFWDADLDPSMHDVLRLHSSTNEMNIDWDQSDKDSIPCVIIHDKLMTDAAFCQTKTGLPTTGTTTVRPIKTEHSYSLSSDGGGSLPPDSPRSFKKDDMEDECFPAISMKTACRKFNEIDDEIDEIKIEIKDEPMSETESFNSSCPSSPLDILNHKNDTCSDLKPFNIELRESQQFLRHSTGLLLNPASQTIIPHKLLQNIPKLNLKIESTTSSSVNFQLPPTPPSCSSSSGDDSEDNVTISPSPSNSKKSNLVSTARLLLNHHTNTRQPIHTHLISSQPKGSTGTLILTEEEKRTLIAEGYPVPTRLPLSKAEEKSLKKIRRKIKNKISAQESRRKKKEYMDQLERKVGLLVHENNEYRKKIEDLQDSNKNLISQMQKLQAIVAKTHPNIVKQLEKI